jgi:hypothetical protein
MTTFGRILASTRRMNFLFGLAVVTAVLSASQTGWAQGCVVARISVPVVGPAAGVTQQLPDDESWFSCHRWEVSTNWRTFHSFRHFVGTTYQAQRAAQHTEVNNEVNVFDYSGTYTVNRRLSLSVNVPVLIAKRYSELTPDNATHGRGVGDISVGGQMWLFGATEGRHNVALGLSMTFPTGNPGLKDTNLNSKGQTQTTVVDQSIQPGSGGYGFALSGQAYQGVKFMTVYGSGLYLFNPMGTNGVPTGRKSTYESVMSVPDQYLGRVGMVTATPGFRRSALSMGMRMEGVPVRDVFGPSNGFRRPGYTLSVDPGFMVSHGKDMLSLNIPVAIQRDRPRSVPDIQAGTSGDAAFADFQILVSYSHHF